MKLHHFVTAEADKDAVRIQEIGKTFAPTKTTRTVAEAVKSIPKKAAVASEDGDDVTQQMRDFAVQQMEGSKHTSHLVRKIRHYD